MRESATIVSIGYSCEHVLVTDDVKYHLCVQCFFVTFSVSFTISVTECCSVARCLLESYLAHIITTLRIPSASSDGAMLLRLTVRVDEHITIYSHRESQQHSAIGRYR